MKNPFGKKSNPNNESEEIFENGENTAKSNDKYAFVKKIGGYFSPEPQREKVLRHEDFNAAGDPYYASVSVGYKITQRFLILFLVVFLVFSFITNYREITFDNFFYLMKEFTSVADTENSNYETLSYNSDSRHVFALYRGGVAIANPSRISIYTATGRNALDLASTFSAPCIEVSNKYALVYDTAGNTFSVYNSLSRIFTKTLDFPITDAHIDEDGGFAVVTRGDATQSSRIYIYNKNFKPYAMIPMSKYAFDVKISKDLDRIVGVYYDNGNGTGQTTVSIRRYSEPEDEMLSISVMGEFPLSFGYLENGRTALMTNRSVRIYDKNFEEINRYEYSNVTLTGFSLSDQGGAVSYVGDSKNIVIAFDKEGNLLYNDNVYRNVVDVAVFGKYVFMRTESGVIRIEPRTTTEEELLSDQGQMLVYDENTVLVCGSSKAEYLVFEE